MEFAERWSRQSQFVGVAYNEARNKWEAARKINGKTYYGGIFISDIEAAKASDDLVRENGGTDKLNFPGVAFLTEISVPIFLAPKNT